ncbi:MAG: sugar ABC transporter permease [Opitutaceae bacterium]
MKLQRHRTALLFLAPNLLGFLAFTLIPVLLSLAGSFTNWSLRPAAPLEFVGGDNYIRMFQDRNFWFYLYNTAYLMLALPLAIGGALGLAVFLHDGFAFRRARRGARLGIGALVIATVSGFTLLLTGSPNLAYVIFALGGISSLGLAFGAVTYRTVFYLPHFTAGAATILLWTQLYNPNFGLINNTLESAAEALGIAYQGPGWLTSTRSLLGFLPLPAHFSNGGFGLGAREAIMLMGIWTAIGGNNLILFLAGLAAIPPELNEAAEIDGANRWQRFRHVTFPQLAPTTFLIVVISIIGGLQGGFEQARLMTYGGPAGTTTTLSYFIYLQGFERLDLGYGSAIAWVLFALVFSLTLMQWRYGKRDGTD